MWRLGCCIAVLLAAPAVAQADGRRTVNTAEQRPIGADRDPYRHLERHPGGVLRHDIAPDRIGPAPAGFWYRCDAPPGIYPYIRVCATAWRLVPSVAHRYR
jgi:hypothetical protein